MNNVRKTGKAGVFGWLSLVVFFMLVFWPLMMVVGLRSYLFNASLDFPQLMDQYVWYYFRTTILFLVFVAIAISMVGGVLLLKRRRRSSVYYAIVAMWVSGPIGHAFALILPVIAYGYSDIQTVIARSTSAFLLDIVLRLICTAYLLFSRRVRRTYPVRGYPYPDELDE